MEKDDGIEAVHGSLPHAADLVLVFSALRAAVPGESGFGLACYVWNRDGSRRWEVEDSASWDSADKVTHWFPIVRPHGFEGRGKS